MFAANLGCMEPSESTSAEPRVDATRRTYLASERTYLAWVRSGLTALALSIGIGRLVPELSSGASWPLEVIGAGFGLVGIVILGYGLIRERALRAALERGEYAYFGGGAAAGLAVAGMVLGLGTVAVVVSG